MRQSTPASAYTRINPCMSWKCQSLVNSFSPCSKAIAAIQMSLVGTGLHHYAHLFYQLRQQGTPIPTNDIWIAALTVEHGLALFSRDSHFDHLPQLARLD